MKKASLFAWQARFLFPLLQMEAVVPDSVITALGPKYFVNKILQKLLTPKGEQAYFSPSSNEAL
jgi:hypothetical protein